MKHRVALFLLIACGIVFGFVQENVKVNINFILEQGDRIPGFFDQDVAVRKEWLQQCTVFSPLDYYHSHKPIEWFYGFSRKSLVRAKWILTPVYAGIFWWINGTVLVLLFGSPKWRIWLLKAYALILVIGFSIYLTGRLFGFPEVAYAVSRKLTGGLQSLIPLMVIVPARYLYHRFQSEMPQ